MPREGSMTDAEIDAAMGDDPTKLNDPEAIETYRDNMMDNGVAPETIEKQVLPKGAVPEVEDTPADEDAAGGTDKDNADAGAEASGTAEEDSPAQNDPVLPAPKTEAEIEASALRKVLEFLPQVLGQRQAEKVAPPPPPPPAHVQQWDKLVKIDAQTARAHFDSMVEEGHTFDAERFIAAWQTAPDHLRDWQEREAFKRETSDRQSAEYGKQMDREISELNSKYKDWEQYSDKMEELALRDRLGRQAKLPPMFESVEDLYHAAKAVVRKGAVELPALNPKDAARKAALGKGPQAGRSGPTAGKPRAASTEQEFIRGLLRNDTII